MRRRLNNKGAAMVSVMIAIAFIAIIATSLLYMAYMNYLTKVMRYNSTDNFYTAEFALDELTTAVQQKGVIQGLGGADVKGAMKSIINDTCNSSITTFATGTYTYNPDKLESLIKVSNNDNVRIDVSSTDPKLVVEATSLTFKNLVITSYDRSNNIDKTTDTDAYISTIRTDLKIQYNMQGSGDLDICDFSMICDSPVQCKADCVISGCIYMQGVKNTTPALRVYDRGVCEVLCPQGIINGNVVIESGCTLVLMGDVVVIGDIVNNGTFICSGKGKLRCTGDIKGSGDFSPAGIDSDPTVEKLTSINTSKIPDRSNAYDDDWDSCDGLSQRLFAPGVLFYDDSSNQWAYFDMEHISNANNARTGFGTNDHVTIKTKYHGDNEMRTVLGHEGNTLKSEQNKFINSLVLEPKGGTFNYLGSFVNSSIVTTQPISFMDTQHPTYLQCMDKESYEGLLNSWYIGQLNSEMGKAYKYDGTNNFYTNHGTELSYGSKKTVPYNKAGTDNEAAPTGSNIEKKEYSLDGGTTKRTAYYDSNTGINYIRVRHLLAEDTGSIISDIFSSVNGTSDPTTSTATYINWSKD